MSDLKLTTAVDAENPVVHDLQLAAGQLQWGGLDPYDPADQAAMIAQRIRCRLQFMQGEWYLDQRQGVPWRQVLTAKGTTKARIAAIFRSAISAVPGVKHVRSVTVSQDFITRTATVTFSAVGDAQQVIGPTTIDLPFILRSEV